MATTVTLKPNAIDISGSTSGTTTLQATAVAGTTTLTLPAATDTLVGKATTDTLTNKTLTGAVMNGTVGATTPSTGAFTTLTSTGASSFATSSGDVGIGTSSPAYKLDVAGTAASQLRLQNSDATSYASMLFTGTGRSFSMGVGNASETGIGVANQFYIYDITAAQTRLRLDSNGGLKVSNIIGVGNTAPSTSGAGITFPATQSASTDANTLDDYEEGTWTPVATNLTVVGSVSYVATYTKIGRVVYINLRVNSTTSSTSTANSTYFDGLPFEPAINSTVTAVNEVNIASLGVGLFANGARLFAPSWTAVQNATLSGFYYV